jgi:hypothetical protein
MLVIVGWKVMLAALLIWLAIVILTEYVSLASLVVAVLFPFYFLLFKLDIEYFAVSALISGLVIWAHRENIKRLQAGKELKLNIKIGFKRQNGKESGVVTEAISTMLAPRAGKVVETKKRTKTSVPKKAPKKAVKKATAAKKRTTK